ncbi:MAG: hypothetical protein JJE40_09775 [Vicinamibacteria bacterium]|nr:hypothetical protein [Vicinamibacteria bacterium]
MPTVGLYIEEDAGWGHPKAVRLERVPMVGEFLAGPTDDEFYVVRAVVHHLDPKGSEVFAKVASRGDMLVDLHSKPD